MKLIVSASIAVGTLAFLSTDGSRNAARLEQRLESAIESTYGKQVTVRPKMPVAKANSAVGGSDGGSNARQQKTAALIVAINGELRRLGCYHGSAEAEWTQESQQALVAFNRHLDAQMPVDKPDPTLLTILRGFREPACAEAQGAPSVHAAAPIAPAPVPALPAPRTAAHIEPVDAGTAKLPPLVTAAINAPAAVKEAAAIKEAKPKRVKPAMAVASGRESTVRTVTKRVADAKVTSKPRPTTAVVDRPSKLGRTPSAVAFNAKTAFDRMNKS